ncbi:hypothetical protein [Deinococcus pimensis]|uniref:hypothetical protein n=1 Tax=Deinococcus pimensis TaxID=309888 RepID=UPI0004B1315C|nr:hypothetical protein [Deinococcus pimensis]
MTTSASLDAAFKQSASATASGFVTLLGEHAEDQQGLTLSAVLTEGVQVAVERAPRGTGQERVVPTAEGSSRGDLTRVVTACCDALAERHVRVPPLSTQLRSNLPRVGNDVEATATAVATLRALRDLLVLNVDDHELARLAWKAVREATGTTVGLASAFTASLGAPGTLVRLDVRSLDARRLALPDGAELLVVLGAQAWPSHEAYLARRQECLAAADALGVNSLRDVVDAYDLTELPELLHRRAHHVVTEVERAREAERADARELGALLNASHASVRDDYQACAPDADRRVRTLRTLPGVLGAKFTAPHVVALARSDALRSFGRSANRTSPEARTTTAWRRA